MYSYLTLLRAFDLACKDGYKYAFCRFGKDKSSRKYVCLITRCGHLITSKDYSKLNTCKWIYSAETGTIINNNLFVVLYKNNDQLQKISRKSLNN